MKTIFVVLSVLFTGNAHADTVCTTTGNVTTCVETPNYEPQGGAVCKGFNC